MMPRTTELPADLDLEELNEMIRDLGREKGLAPGIHPDLIGPDEDYHHYWGNGNEERHKESVAWRRKLIAELKRRPDWIAEWRAAAEMDRRVEAICERKGLRFSPHECPPWWIRVDTELPPRRGSDDLWTESARLAQRLRRELEAEIAEEDTPRACRAGDRYRRAGLGKGSDEGMSTQ
jgi:hypothetical protein